MGGGVGGWVGGWVGGRRGLGGFGWFGVGLGGFQGKSRGEVGRGGGSLSCWAGLLAGCERRGERKHERAERRPSAPRKQISPTSFSACSEWRWT